mgnify:CR=1 FL=1
MLSLLPTHHLIHSAFGFKHDVDNHFFQMANAQIGTARSHSYIGSRRIELYSVLSNTKSFGLFAYTLFVVVVFCVALESIYCGLQLNASKMNGTQAKVIENPVKQYNIFVIVLLCYISMNQR